MVRELEKTDAYVTLEVHVTCPHCKEVHEIRQFVNHCDAWDPHESRAEHCNLEFDCDGCGNTFIIGSIHF